jgi:acid phosphatase (class A)
VKHAPLDPDSEEEAMARLGASNTNTNTNTVLGSPGEGVATGVRFNSQEFPKVRDLRRFPSELPANATNEEKSAYHDDMEIANRQKFRKYWDAELRASIYLNEFLAQHPAWLDQLIGETRPKYLQLQAQKDEQLRLVIGASDEREPRFVEIIDQNDAEGAIKYWLGMLMIDAHSAPATYQLIRAARRIGEVVVMCLKHHFREARPSQACPAIVPMIDPPVTPSFPAGHALSAHLISAFLRAAQRPFVQPAMLDTVAGRVAYNRVIAGLHYPLDNEAGARAADLVYSMLIAKQKTDNGEVPRCPQFALLLEEARLESARERNPEQEPGTEPQA